VTVKAAFANPVSRRHGLAPIAHDCSIQVKIGVSSHATTSHQKAKICVMVGNPKSVGLLRKEMVGFR
jgi:hypothetical protein|tara:strand:+ start:792 stop:992 length:201 start_codon:yes stop_codon:yes gene_type:complete